MSDRQVRIRIITADQKWDFENSQDVNNFAAAMAHGGITAGTVDEAIGAIRKLSQELKSVTLNLR